jgi:hypothetical protein
MSFQKFKFGTNAAVALIKCCFSVLLAQVLAPSSLFEYFYLENIMIPSLAVTFINNGCLMVDTR